jgi:processive 1,2-diacylglycerol beta-glucosyltransferase
MAKYKILVNIGDKSSCSLYRGYLPSFKLKKELDEAGIQIDSAFKLQDIDVNSYDCFYFGRIPTNPDLYIFIDSLYRRKKKILWDIDDELWNIPKENKYAAQYIPSHVAWLNYYFAMSTRVTVSTNNLARSVAAKWGTNPLKICVLENLISVNMYKNTYTREYNLHSNPVKILYSGSDSHAGDLKPVSDLFQYYNKNKDVMFMFYGIIPEELLAEDVEKVMHFGWSPNRKYYEPMLNIISPHIGLIPLYDNSFNSCKSSIKNYEMAMSGAIPIASNLQPYSDTIIHGETGFLCTNMNDWINNCERIVDNRDEAERISKTAKETVIQEYSWDRDNKRRRDWLEFFRSVPDM